MPREELGSLRRSQVITTFGPGSVVDFRTGGRRGAPVSVIVAGIETWDSRTATPGLDHPQAIHEPRLENRLGVYGFRQPPVTGDWPGRKGSVTGEELYAYRFPRWLRCPRCQNLRPARNWRRHPGSPGLSCAGCSSDPKTGARKVYVVPVRFITACPNGHLDEYPWHSWVQHKPGCEPGDLRLYSEGGSGLSSLVLYCPKCKTGENMEGCFGEEALDTPCSGRRPWLDEDDESCDRMLRTLQRGASNLYFPIIRSSLDIPPWSDLLQRQLGKDWGRLKDMDSAEQRRAYIELSGLDSELDTTVDSLTQEIEERVDLLGQMSDDLRREEYQQFISGSRTGPGALLDQEAEFEVEEAPRAVELSPVIGQVVRAKRLREVRALQGFTRIHPPEHEDSEIAPLSSGGHPGWLPAVEVKGEGIFVELSDAKVREWEERDEVRERFSRFLSADELVDLEVHAGPRFLLVHSLAHALIRSISLECGYGAASLRERLYVGEEMAGCLIYTATPDSEGTLGGLVQQADEELFLTAITRALDDASWCASDPLCITGRAALSDPLNAAACHNCMLLPETSCEQFNQLLDRAALVGTPVNRGLGFFEGLVAADRITA